MMLSIMKLRLCIAIGFLAGSFAFADTDVSTTTNPPIVLARTNPPVVISPEQMEIARTFQVKRGFRVESIAGDSPVWDPVAMAFDESGQMFVIEGGGSNPQNGDVRILRDCDTNGFYHSSSVYASSVPSPSALVCYGGGIFVGAAGEIIYLKDTDSNGIVDARREVFKSFGETANGVSGKVVITSLAWGLDNRIHASTAGAGGDVISSSSPVQSIVLTNGNFLFDPRSFMLASESGSGPSGMAFDNSGHRFVSSPTRHLQMVMYEVGDATRNPWVEMPPLLNDLAGTGPASFIYPPARQNPLAHYPDGSTPTRFSGATGLMIYRGSAFPPEFMGDAFVIDATGDVIHRDKLRASGGAWVATRPDGEEGSEFLVVKDNSFQLRQVVNGPDGSLYFTGVVKNSLAKGTKTNAPSVSDAPRGRIYRIVPVNFRQPKPQPLAKASAEQLVLALRHPNGFQRDVAARLIYERQEKAAVIPLIRLLFDSTASPLGRMQALRALDGLQITGEGKPGKALMLPHVIKALQDPDERVREQGVLLSIRFIAPGKLIPEKLWEALSPLGNDPSLQVRYQLAFLLGQVQQSGRVPVLAQIARMDATNRWVEGAVLGSLSEGAGEVFGALAGDANFRATKGGQEFLQSLLMIIGQENHRAEVAQAMRDLGSISNPQVAFMLAVAMENALQRANESLNIVDASGIFTPLYIRAENLVLDTTLDDPTRIAALRLLCSVTNTDARIDSALVNEWPAMRPGLRGETMMFFLSRGDDLATMLYAMQGAYLPTTDVTPIEKKLLFAYQNQPIHESAVALFGSDGLVSRRAVVNQYLRALQLPGRVERGAQVYQMRCAACHQIGEQHGIGLSLDAATRMSKETVLTKTLDPNRDGTSAHPEVMVVNSDHEILIGFVARENPKSTTLLDPNGVERTVGHVNNVYEKSLDISGMPDGLEVGLTVQDMADLLEFISSNAK